MQPDSVLKYFFRSLKFFQFFGILGFLFHILNIYRMSGETSLPPFIASLFLIYAEKVAVGLDRFTIALANPQNTPLPNSVEIDYLENNYSFITQQLPSFSEIPQLIYRHLPLPLQKSVDYIDHEICMTRNETIIRILKNGHCAKNITIDFSTLSDKEASLLIEALKNEKIPPGLKINFDHPNYSLYTEIQALMQKNNLHHAALACVTLQQGSRDPHSLLSLLPQEILEAIYENIYPETAKPEKLKTFLYNTSGYHCFFKPQSSHFSGKKKEEKSLENTNRRTHS